LLILGFPSTLYAGDLSIAQGSLVPAHSQQVLAVSPRQVGLRNREHGERHVLLMDADVRLRAAAAIFGNPTIEKAVEHAGVPVRMIILTASPILEA
jgi:hypothetical protein